MFPGLFHMRIFKRKGVHKMKAIEQAIQPKGDIKV